MSGSRVSMEFIAYLVLSIAAIIGALALAWAICIRLGHYLQTNRAIRLMRRSGRLLSVADFEQRVAHSTGTVLFECPTLGWRVLRVWWTPDDVPIDARAAGLPEPSPASPDGEVSPFEIWCHDTYTDLQSGRALLVPFYLFGSDSQRFSQSLRTRFPALRSAMVWSALIHHTRTDEPNGNA